MRHGRRRAGWTSTAVKLICAVLSLVVLAAVLRARADAEVDPQLVVNGSFERGLEGWRTNQEHTSLHVAPGGPDGSSAVTLDTRPGTNAVLNDRRNTVAHAAVGTRYHLTAWVRTNAPPLSGQLRVREVAGPVVRGHTKTFWLRDDDWRRLDLVLEVTTDGAELDLNVLAWDLERDQRLSVDGVSMMVVASEPPTDSVLRLSSGAAVSARGVPASGALLGASVGSNSDPAEFEAEIGQRLGLRRTYWGPDQVDRAVDVAGGDLSSGRLPWISFKLPHSWSRMAQGEGDAWVLDLSVRLSRLPGPVWVAFHHEPEGDGDIGDWRRMQERLGPMVRSSAPNVAFTVVLTGWHQVHGEEKYALPRIWPRTEVDVAGFDVYNSYGVRRDGERQTRVTDLRKEYFEPISRWAKTRGVAWAVAETGLTDRASKRDPDWLSSTYDDLVALDGVALSYFNSSLNSRASWAVTTPQKTARFAAAIKRTPTFPKVG